MEFNHDRTLSDFQNNIDKLKANGFNPIVVSQMYLEDVFVFKTKKEAKKAYRKFERDEKENWIGNIAGWWYSKSDFKKTIKEYEKKYNLKILIHWIDDVNSI